MVSSINSNSDYLYATQKNNMLNAIYAAASTSNSSTFSLQSVSADSNSSDSESQYSTTEELLEMMQSGSRMMPPMGPPPEEGDTATLPSDIDTDGDGTLSSDEYETMITQSQDENVLNAEDFFSQYDTDGDGEITKDEMSAAMPKPPMGPPPEAQGSSTLSSDIDTDGDGTLSSDEYESLISQFEDGNVLNSEDFFSQYDTDGDGEITSDELLTALQNNSSTTTNDRLASSTIQAYNNNYQYMFDTYEGSTLNSAV